MKYNDLNLTAKKSKSRVGRGIAAGQGKTAGRGTKGYGSRTGSTRKPGFEGGQNPLMKRLPKLRGFQSHRTGFEELQIRSLTSVKGTVVDNNTVYEAGLTTSPYTRVKLIGNDEVKGKLTVKLQGASKSAVEMINKAGGSFEIVERNARPESKKKDETR